MESSSLLREAARHSRKSPGGARTNGGVPRSQKIRAQQYACAQAMWHLRAPCSGMYGMDELRRLRIASARYTEGESFRGVLPMGVDEDGRVHVSTRPGRSLGGRRDRTGSSRVSFLNSAWMIREQREFDTKQPLPAEAQRWMAMRCELQAKAAGDAQIWPGWGHGAVYTGCYGFSDGFLRFCCWKERIRVLVG